MAWSPKTFDITKINNGNQYKNGDGVYADDINAVVEGAAYAQALAVQEPNTKNVDKVGTPSVSIEIYDGLPRLKFENLKGEKGDDHNLEINDLYTRVEENARQINTVKQVMVQNEQVVMLPLVDSFKTRITAKGANIFDEQYTPVSTVEGNTVVDKNSNTFKNAYFKGITSTGKNLLMFPYSYDSQTINGITFTVNRDGTITANGTATDTSIFYLNGAVQERMVVGQSYTISDIRGDGYYTRVLYTENGVNKETSNSSFTFTVKPSYCSIEIRINAGTTLNNVVFKPMLNFGDTALPYEPYVEDTLELPTSVECGLGTTIDLENRKIINRGKEIKLQSAVLTEDETANEEIIKSYIGFLYYPNEKHYVLSIANGIPTVEKRANGVSSYGFVATVDSQQIWTKGALWLGVDNSTVYWLDCADYLGLSSNSTTWANGLNSEPTADEILAVKKAFHAFLQNNPVSIRYVASTGTETDLGAGVFSSYKAWKNGTETIIQGDIDNSEYGANPKITQTYIAKVGGEE